MSGPRGCPPSTCGVRRRPRPAPLRGPARRGVTRALATGDRGRVAGADDGQPPARQATPDEDSLIRIHRLLEEPGVPRYVVEAVVHHELVHAICRRRSATAPAVCPHAPVPRQRERQFRALRPSQRPRMHACGAAPARRAESAARRPGDEPSPPKGASRPSAPIAFPTLSRFKACLQPPDNSVDKPLSPKDAPTADRQRRKRFRENCGAMIWNPSRLAPNPAFCSEFDQDSPDKTSSALPRGFAATGCVSEHPPEVRGRSLRFRSIRTGERAAEPGDAANLSSGPKQASKSSP